MAIEDLSSRQFWWDFGEKLRARLVDEEKTEAVAVGCARMAARRGVLLRRDPIEEDVAFAASIFTWWPGKPDPAPHVEAELIDIRSRIFHEMTDENLRWLDSLVPNRTLRMDLASLYAAQRQEVRAFLDVDKPRPPDAEGGQQADSPFAGELEIPRLQLLAAEAFEPAIAGE